MRARTAALALCFTLFAVLSPARAEEPRHRASLEWDPAWHKFRPVEYVATSVAGVASLGAFFVLKSRRTPSWTGGILFDNAARDAFRLRSPAARDTVRTLSDITALSTVVALAVDSLVVPMVRGKPDVAWQMALMDTEAFAFSTLITTTMYKTTGRARPSYADCQRDRSFDPLCNAGSTTSFPSGHGNGAFTAAGLSCVHHARLSVYGDRLADSLACAFGVTLAFTTSAFRVLGDRHYVSDVVVGDLIGFGIGYGAPTLLHYTGASDSAVSLAPLGGNQRFGLLASGTF